MVVASATGKVRDENPGWSGAPGACLDCCGHQRPAVSPGSPRLWPARRCLGANSTHRIEPRYVT